MLKMFLGTGIRMCQKIWRILSNCFNHMRKIAFLHASDCNNILLPADVDLTVFLCLSWLQDYLSDEDFENLLGVSRAEFLGMSQWRQIELKKKAGIFQEAITRWISQKQCQTSPPKILRNPNERAFVAVVDRNSSSSFK